MMQRSKIRRIVLSLAVAMFVVFGLGMSNAFAADGTVTISIEKSTLGQGYLIAPTKVSITDNETVETVLKRFLESEVGSGNYTFNDYGYFSGIKDYSMNGPEGTGDIDLAKVPQYIQDAVDGLKDAEYPPGPITTKASTQYWLKEKDFNNFGGYTYRVNQTWGQSMNQVHLHDGDVVRIAYSIVGTGSEWAVTGWEDGSYQWPTYPERNDLIKTLAEAKEKGLESTDEYKAAAAAATTLPGSADDISSTKTALQTKIDAGFDGTATVSVEKFVMGQGYIVEPTKVQIKNGESAENVLKRVIDQELGTGKYRIAGFNTYVTDDDMKAQDTDLKMDEVPDYIKTYLQNNNITLRTAANEAGWLGSYDFANAGGFVAEKNNTPFTEGFATTAINNGDNVRFGFSFTMGSDWQKADWDTMGQTFANVDELQKTMVAAKEKKLQDSDEYKAAVAASSTLPGTQADVDKADADLKALINGSGKINVVVDVEKFTLGQGYLIEPTVVPAEKGETVTAVVKRFLESKAGAENVGYKYRDDPSYGFYLEAVKDDSMQAANTDLNMERVPSYIKEKMDEDHVSYSTAAATAGWLTEKDFTNQAGFMYTVNNNPVNAMDSVKVQDNDVIRIGYSLAGYGNDWYKNFEPYWQDYADKSMATAAIADAAKYGVTGDEVAALKAEAAKLPGDQTAVNNATKKVTDAISEKMPGGILGKAKGEGYNYKSDWTVNGEIGTTGKGKKMTGMKFDIQNNPNLGVSYEAHVANVGWMDAVADGAEAGKGNNAIEAVKIKLTGADADKYDVFYRAHVANIGWMQWTQNGEMAGTQGLGYAVEAIEAFVAPKGSTYDHNEYNYQKASVVPEKGSGRAHIQNIGDGQGFVPFNQVQKATIGTEGKSLRLEGITLKDEDPDLNLTYRAHCQNVGWTNWVNEGDYAGTQGNGLRMEAVEIKAEGPNADKYDIEYRAHVQNIGWMDWVKNGEKAGTEGESLRVEAIEIRFVEK